MFFKIKIPNECEKIISNPEIYVVVYCPVWCIRYTEWKEVNKNVIFKVYQMAKFHAYSQQS